MAHAKTEALAERSEGGRDMRGIISRTGLMRLEFDDGLSVIGPEEVVMKEGALGTVGDIIDIVCKFIDCGGHGGGGGGGGGDGCTTITIQNPDGSSTTIKQCPPKDKIT